MTMAVALTALALAVAVYGAPPTYGGAPPYGGYSAAPPPGLHMPGDGAGCARRWEQCGGKGSSAAGCCVGYNGCVARNEYFSMCEPTALPTGVVGEFGRCGPLHPCEPLTACKPLEGPADVSLCLDPVHERRSEHDCSKAKRWSQCGGKKWTGPRVCRGEYDECTVVNDTFSMCVPTAAATDAGCARHWDACGGIDHKGQTCCEPGTECVVVNPWYSQCKAAQ